MMITSKGQVTIPIKYRESLGLLPNTEVEFEMDGNRLLVLPKGQKSAKTRGQRLIEHMKGLGDISMTTDEIMALTRGED